MYCGYRNRLLKIMDATIQACALWEQHAPVSKLGALLNVYACKLDVTLALQRTIHCR